MDKRNKLLVGNVILITTNTSLNELRRKSGAKLKPLVTAKTQSKGELNGKTIFVQYSCGKLRSFALVLWNESW